MEIYHGDILYSENREKLNVYENSYIAVENGLVEGIYAQIPEKFSGVEVTDYGRALIIPAFSDLHVHAAQFIQRGIGMDLLLSDWLNIYTFPQESHFADPSYAEPIYEAYVNDMIRHGTFHACIFTTIHRHSTNILFKKLEEKGLRALVGKVNMDFQSPDYLCETTEESLRETEIFLDEHSGGERVKPILTPRFVPTCSRELLWGLGKLGKKYQVGVQTHVVESRWEAAESLRLFPDCRSDSEIYEKAGLLGNGPSVFAHVIFPTEDDLRVMKEYHCTAVHCPDATNNVIAGIMAVDRLHREGLHLALGSDIGAGQQNGIYRQCAAAVKLSKLKEFYEPELGKTINIADSFYMATKAGGEVFGNVGTFEPGYVFDALVIDNLEDEGHPMTPAQRLERFCYAGDDRNIIARYLNGSFVGNVSF